MTHLLSILSITLALVLFPPAALAVVSNNAVPGDTIYPIKRFLEDRIYDVASINPTTKAWFAAARSDRRFKEVRVLVNSGKQAKTTLRELVSQAETTVEEIAKVEDPTRKNQLLDQYKETIEDYKKGLEELKQQAISTQEVAKPVDQLISAPTPSPTPTTAPSPQPTTAPGISTPPPIKRPTPTSSPRPTRTPTPFPTPTPQASAPGVPTNPDDINKAIDDLDKIGKKADKQKNSKTQSIDTTPIPEPAKEENKLRISSTGDSNIGSTASQTLPTPTPTVCPIPSRPSGLTFISGTKTVSWDAVASAAYYNIRLVTPNLDQHNFDNITNSWYTFPDHLVASSGNYSWWVDAINECGVDREGSSFTIGLP